MKFQISFKQSVASTTVHAKTITAPTPEQALTQAREEYGDRLQSVVDIANEKTVYNRLHK